MDKINLDRFKWRIWDKGKNEYIDQMDCCYWDLYFLVRAIQRRQRFIGGQINVCYSRY